MGKKSPPPPPDYAAIANQQAQASAANTQSQTAANRPDLYTPWGSQTWQQEGDNWASTVQLSPQQQEALDSQMAVQTGRSQAAEGLLNTAVQGYQGPLDYSGIAEGAQHMDPQMLQAPGATQQSLGPQGAIQGQMQNTAGDWRQRGQDAALNFMRPQQEQRQAALEGQLANMGLTRGSEAWNREMGGLRDQTTRDQLQAFGAGQSEANMLFGQDLQSGQFANQAQNQGFNQSLAGGQFFNQGQQQNYAQLAQQAAQNNQAGLQAGNFNQQLRQQQIAEMLAQRSQPLNELNALLTGQQVNNPQMPSFNQAQRSETPQLLNAANMGYQADMDAFNAESQGTAGLMSGIGSLASTGAMLF